MYTDGGSRGNPGPAAIGVWVETLNKKYCECIGNRTNNEAEYEALIFGLKKIKAVLGNAKAKKSEVACYLDSELVVKQLNHEYKINEKHIQAFFLEIWNLMLDFHKVTFHHVRREKNTIADALVNQALDGVQKQSNLF
jgi:ribonuclease HI